MEEMKDVRQFAHVLIGLLMWSAVALGQDPRQPPPNPGSTKPGGSGGITFGGKTKAELLPNPYRFSATLDVVAQAILPAIKNKQLSLDEQKSRPREGVFVTQPYVFVQGILTSKAELEHYATMPAADARTWLKGRYRLEITITPVDAQGTLVAVNAEIEGLAQDVLTSNWVKGQSKGLAENEFLIALREVIELK
jgi:hypothetical protein